jgi:hypothetical protein
MASSRKAVNMVRWFCVSALGLLVAAGSGCSKKESKQAPLSDFSCEALQKRAEACESVTLAQVKAGMANRSDAELQFKMFESRFKKKLAEGGTRSQCEKFESGSEDRARLESMKGCYAQQGCDAFAKCMLAL